MTRLPWRRRLPGSLLAICVAAGAVAPRADRLQEFLDAAKALMRQLDDREQLTEWPRLVQVGLALHELGRDEQAEAQAKEILGERSSVVPRLVGFTALLTGRYEGADPFLDWDPRVPLGWGDVKKLLREQADKAEARGQAADAQCYRDAASALGFLLGRVEWGVPGSKVMSTVLQCLDDASPPVREKLLAFALSPSQKNKWAVVINWLESRLDAKALADPRRRDLLLKLELNAGQGLRLVSRALGADDFDLAIAAYDAVLATRPDRQPNATELEVRALLAAGRFAQAAAAERMIEAKLGLRELRVRRRDYLGQLASAGQRLGRPAALQAAYDEAQRGTAAGTVEAWLALADCQMFQNDRTGLIETYTRALAVSPPGELRCWAWMRLSGWDANAAWDKVAVYLAQPPPTEVAVKDLFSVGMRAHCERELVERLQRYAGESGAAAAAIGMIKACAGDLDAVKAVLNAPRPPSAQATTLYRSFGWLAGRYPVESLTTYGADDAIIWPWLYNQLKAGTPRLWPMFADATATAMPTLLVQKELEELYEEATIRTPADATDAERAVYARMTDAVVAWYTNHPTADMEQACTAGLTWLGFVGNRASKASTQLCRAEGAKVAVATAELAAARKAGTPSAAHLTTLARCLRQYLPAELADVYLQRLRQNCPAMPLAGAR